MRNQWLIFYLGLDMKKALATTVVVLAGAASTTASAQSSVTLYGTLDTGIDYVSNQKGSSNFMNEAANLSTNRWGVRGNEDLGGGLKAIFDLESGFNITNGKLNNGGDEFGRQAWVGLSSNTLGTVTMGRQYDFIVDFVAPMSATGSGWGGNLAMHPFDNDNLDNDVRLNNSVKFRSVDYNGFTFGGAYAFSNQAGGMSNNSAYSVGAAYANGPVNLAVAYLQANQPGMTTSGAIPGGTIGTSTGDSDAMLVGARQRVFAAGGHYTFGRAAVGLVVTRTILDDPTQVMQGGAYSGLQGSLLTFTNYEVNGRYAITPTFSVAAAYTYTDGYFSSGSASSSPKWNQVTVQADYALSKRTELYVEGAYQRVSQANGNAVLGNASIFSLAASSNGNQTVVGAGMRMRF
jgi:predicted porin